MTKLKPGSKHFFLTEPSESVLMESYPDVTVFHKALFLDQSLTYFTLVTYQIISLPTDACLQIILSFSVNCTPLRTTTFSNMTLTNSVHGLSTGSWTLNVTKRNLMTIIINSKPNISQYQMFSHPWPRVNTTTYLGVTVDYRLTWSDRINTGTVKACKTLGMGKHTQDLYTQWVKEMPYTMLEYEALVWISYTQHGRNKLEKVQCSAARFVTNNHRFSTSVISLLNNLGRASSPIPIVNTIQNKSQSCQNWCIHIHTCFPQNDKK